jgi:hypothetical protein
VEFLPGMRAAEQISVGAEPSVLPQVVLFEEATVRVERRSRRSLAPSRHRTGEFWETLTYLALWICGWAGVGLCLF